MDVHLSLSDYRDCLQFRVEADGDQIVGRPAWAELEISDQMLVSDGINSRSVNKRYGLPRVFIDLLGLDTTSPTHAEDYFISKWFDYREGWAESTFIGVPIRGTANGGLGEDSVVATAGRYVDDFFLRHLFDKTDFTTVLTNLVYRGMVTLKMTLEDDKVVDLTTGSPYMSLFNLLEGRGKKKVSELFTSPHPDFLESWTIAMKVFQWPITNVIFPQPPERLKHFWPRASVGVDGFVGLVTAWGYELYEAESRALRTAKSLSIPNKVYRTDLRAEVKRVWKIVSEKAIL